LCFAKNLISGSSQVSFFQTNSLAANEMNLTVEGLNSESDARQEWKLAAKIKNSESQAPSQSSLSVMTTMLKIRFFVGTQPVPTAVGFAFQTLSQGTIISW
jgi:hypothetical protein